MMSRRNLMLAGPAALFPLAAASTVSGPIAIDPHSAWLEEWRDACQAWSALLNLHDDETDESEAIWSERERLEQLIYSTPPMTLGGIRAQIAWVLEDTSGDSGWDRHMSALTLAARALQ